MVLTIQTKAIFTRYKIIPRNDHPINAARKSLYAYLVDTRTYPCPRKGVIAAVNPLSPSKA